jgi:hypothetical protein
MDREPQLSAQDLIDQLHCLFEKLCQEVTTSVNQAPAGQVINASEEKVRDLFADFRQTTFQAAIQLRLNAAQAAFPPSRAPADRQAIEEQRGSKVLRSDDQRPHRLVPPPLRRGWGR